MMAILNSVIALATFLGLSMASFQVFDGYDPSIQINLDVSTTCFTALNSTVNCDAATAHLAALGVDYNYWYQENVTTLCTSSCSESLDSWLSNVETACASDNINQGGVLVQAKIVPLQYTYWYSLACLQDSASNWCLIESQDWEGSDYIRYNPDLCYQDDPPEECCEDGFSVSQIDESMMAIPNMYDRDVMCSECFMSVWRQRLLSPFLPVSNFTDYLVAQFDNMQTNCSTSMPVATSASTLYVGTPSTTTSVAVTSTTGTAAVTTCTGQLVAPLETPLSCNELADLYNVSTGDLRVATDDFYCQFDNTTVAELCLPLPCPIITVDTYNETCDGYVAQLSNSTTNVTSVTFFGWNQNVQGACDSLAIDQRICGGPPGGSWAVDGVAYAPTGTTAYHTTASPATPTQTGSVSDCGLYYSAVAGDTCNQICLVYGLTFAALQALNTYLNDDCTNLWLGYSVCVAETVPDPTSTDGLCGPSNGFADCMGSGFGDCCSTSGFCGSSDAYCGAGNCYSGACTGPASGVTTNGTCGPDWGGLRCDNASFGPCCSIYGYCGDGDGFCGAGNCYSGACDTDSGGQSINGECGPLFAGNKTCVGTQFGTCCSVNGYCGSTDDYCCTS